MKVQGENVALLVYDGGAWKPIACARTVSLTTASDFIDTSVSGSGSWRTVFPTKLSFQGSIEGLTAFDITNTLALSDLRALQFSRSRLRVMFERTDNASNVYSDEFYCYLQSITDNNPFDNVCNFDITFTGDGAITQVFVPTPQNPNNPVKRYEYTGSGGETGFTEALLINKTILSVVKDGIGGAKLKTSGSPASKEVVYTSASGHFEFAIPYEAGEESYVLYQDP